MVHPIEFMNGVMLTSAIFITTAGIALALVSTHANFGRLYRILFLISILVGCVAITSALAWFNDTNIRRSILAQISLLVQFGLLIIPFGRLVALIERE